MLPLNEMKHFQAYRSEQVAFATGDRIRISQNGFTPEARRGVAGKGKDRLNNGSVYEIDGFTRQGDIRLTNGFVVPKDFSHFNHGYVVTFHASQGKTVDTVLLAVGEESFAAANKEQFYVSISRGREAVRLYTDDKAAMLDAVKRSGARLSASELMGNPQWNARSFLYQLGTIKLVLRGSFDGTRQEAYGRANCEPVASG